MGQVMKRLNFGLAVPYVAGITTTDHAGDEWAGDRVTLPRSPHGPKGREPYCFFWMARGFAPTMIVIFFQIPG